MILLAEILDQITIKNVTFFNRVVMAPMVLFGYSSKLGIMGEKMLQHYFKRAHTGIGLIISQALSVTSKIPFIGGACVYSDSHVVYLKQIADTCHFNGTKFFAQLAYPGFDYRNGDSINDLTEMEIVEIQNEFISAAKICKTAGCDGIELHGAHGFFLNLFSSSLSNNRNDKFGGDINGRLLFIKNIIAGIKEFADDNFIISYRLGWDNSLDTDIETAKALAKIGIELLHISLGIPSDRSLETPIDFSFNNVVLTGANIKKNISIPVIIVNDIKTLNRGNHIIKNNLGDFIAYGRPFLADEDFMLKSLKNFDYKPCIECKNCLWYINSDKCPAQNNA